MAKFYRVMTQSEWGQVQATKTITPSPVEWGVHQAGTVFFIFEDSVGMKDVEACAAERTRDRGQPTVLIAFELTNLSNIEDDLSGWSGQGARAYRGTLREDETRQGFKRVCRFG